MVYMCTLGLHSIIYTLLLDKRNKYKSSYLLWLRFIQQRYVIIIINLLIFAEKKGWMKTTHFAHVTLLIFILK